MKVADRLVSASLPLALLASLPFLHRLPLLFLRRITIFARALKANVPAMEVFHGHTSASGDRVGVEAGPDLPRFGGEASTSFRPYDVIGLIVPRADEVI